MTTLTTLQHSVANIAGLSIGQLAERYRVTLPRDLTRAKGWLGQFVEQVLGASAGCRPEADFPELGIELKTLPLNKRSEPQETTFVTTIDLARLAGETWETSAVKRKLSHVLWIPYEAARDIPIAKRRLGSGIFWQPTAKQETILKTDWQELTDMLALGDIEAVSGRFGEYLHVRPKAADGSALRKAFDAKGATIQTLPRGFYLRTKLTKEILRSC